MVEVAVDKGILNPIRTNLGCIINSLGLYIALSPGPRTPSFSSLAVLNSEEGLVSSLT